MYRILAFLALAASVSAQGQYDPRNAAIINEQRYLSGDGTFGAQYTQEDGVQFKEESDASGNRVGSYSYVDPSGQRRTVSYTAGKNGFQATGDGIPQPPATPVPVAPEPQYTPLPQYNPPDYQPPQPQYNTPQYQPQPQYQPPPQPQYQPPPQPQYQPPPQPQYQPPPQPQYRPQPQYEPTTPAPHRFYPPGKLSLNRSPDGFSYSFQKS